MFGVFRHRTFGSVLFGRISSGPLFGSVLFGFDVFLTEGSATPLTLIVPEGGGDGGES